MLDSPPCWIVPWPARYARSAHCFSDSLLRDSRSAALQRDLRRASVVVKFRAGSSRPRQGGGRALAQPPAVVATLLRWSCRGGVRWWECVTRLVCEGLCVCVWVPKRHKSRAEFRLVVDGGGSGCGCSSTVPNLMDSGFEPLLGLPPAQAAENPTAPGAQFGCQRRRDPVWEGL